MKSRRIWRTGLIALGILAGAWAFAALLLPVLWPFLIGLAVSLLAEKPVRLLQTRARFPRGLASGVCVRTLFVLLFGGAVFLCRLRCTEAADLARQLPQLRSGRPGCRLDDDLIGPVRARIDAASLCGVLRRALQLRRELGRQAELRRLRAGAGVTDRLRIRRALDSAAAQC